MCSVAVCLHCLAGRCPHPRRHLRCLNDVGLAQFADLLLLHRGVLGLLKNLLGLGAHEIKNLEATQEIEDLVDHLGVVI